MHQYEKELKVIADAIEGLMQAASDLPAELSTITQRLTNKLRMEHNFVNGLRGVEFTSEINAATSQPLTSIMGSPIERTAPVTIESVMPSDEDRDKFLKDRDNLYNQMLTLKDEQLHERSKMPGGEALIRATAKKAGVDNYSKGRLNKVFYDAIRDNIKAENDRNEALTKAAEELKKI